MARPPDVRRLIEKKRCFVLHAPRQVGKTTTLLSLGRELTAEGRYHLTQCQPWLINALGQQLTEVLVQDPTQPITADHVEQARSS
ncbi:hypothetical protein BE08_13380 [Sorangium cellulosum]|uniref:AAA domain-containing protein n=1 Tax=Sorangium cellulosum TaxID=56 RepID=A0A150PCX1_SORCE|nr:hypothetical protein BE08_13380 [Sorangium cellulosum]